MTSEWTAAELADLEAAEELEIAVHRADGTLRRWTPIWVVVAGGEPYVRTWHRRNTGWYGGAVEVGRARIRVPGLERDVAIEDVGDESAVLRADVETAYRLKYARHGASSVDAMLTADAVASTLRLVPDPGPDPNVP